MTHRPSSIVLMAFGATLHLVTSASAVTVFFDTFENGPNAGETSTKLNDAFDAQDLSWFSALDFGVASLVNDSFAGGGSQKALQLASTDTFRRMGAAFTSTALGANVGDQLILSADMRLTQTPASNQIGFRFGLFNSNGTSITGDNPQGTTQPTAQNDDFGYHVRISTGAPTILENGIYDEPAGDNPTGGTIGGTLIGSAASPTAINDQNLHKLLLAIARTSATSISLSYSFDGVLKTTAIDASPVTTFDTVYFAKGNIATNFVVDNVRLEAVAAPSAAAVPEPATASMALMTLAAIAMRRRRR